MKQVTNKQNNKYFVVEIKFDEQFRQYRIINRWKVLYKNRTQCIVKKTRGEARIFRVQTGYWQGSDYVKTFQNFSENYGLIKHCISDGRTPSWRYILIQRKFYNEFKEKIYELNDVSEHSKLTQLYKRNKNLLKDSFSRYKYSEKVAKQRVKEAEEQLAEYEERKRILEKAKTELITFQKSIDDEDVKREIDELLNDDQ